MPARTACWCVRQALAAPRRLRRLAPSPLWGEGWGEGPRRILPQGHDQPPCLAPIWRDHRRARQQQFDIGAQHRLIGERRAGTGAQHRVHHQRHAGIARAQAVDPARHHRHVLGAAQQPGLDGSGRHVVGQRGQLRVEQFGRHGLDARHAHRVLRRDRRDHRAQVHTEGLGRALVGTQARAAARIVAGDAPDNRFSYGFRSCWRKQIER